MLITKEQNLQKLPISSPVKTFASIALQTVIIGFTNISHPPIYTPPIIPAMIVNILKIFLFFSP